MENTSFARTARSIPALALALVLGPCLPGEETATAAPFENAVAVSVAGARAKAYRGFLLPGVVPVVADGADLAVAPRDLDASLSPPPTISPAQPNAESPATGGAFSCAAPSVVPPPCPAGAPD